MLLQKGSGVVMVGLFLLKKGDMPYKRYCIFTGSVSRGVQKGNGEGSCFIKGDGVNNSLS